MGFFGSTIKSLTGQLKSQSAKGAIKGKGKGKGKAKGAIKGKGKSSTLGRKGLDVVKKTKAKLESDPMILAKLVQTLVEETSNVQFELTDAKLKQLAKIIESMKINNINDLRKLLLGGATLDVEDPKVQKLGQFILENINKNQVGGNYDDEVEIEHLPREFAVAKLVAKDKGNPGYSDYVESEIEDIVDYDYTDEDERMIRQMGGSIDYRVGAHGDYTNFQFPKEPNSPVWGENTMIQPGLYENIQTGGSRRKPKIQYVPGDNNELGGEHPDNRGLYGSPFQHMGLLPRASGQEPQVSPRAVGVGGGRRKRKQRGGNLTSNSPIFNRNYGTPYRTSGSTNVNHSYN